jgi:SPP1 gp7 family putative phage head morphogenesis protein
MMNRPPTELPKSLQNIDIKAVLRKRGIYFEQKANKEMKELALPVAKEIVKGKQKQAEPRRYLHFTNDEAMAYANKQVHLIEVIEKKLEVKLQQFISKLVSGYLQTIEAESTKKVGKRYIGKAKDYFDDNEANLLSAAQLDFTPLLVDQAVLAGQEALKLVGSKDVYIPGQLRDVVAANVAKFTKSMLDTDRQKMIDILTNGLEQGRSIPDIRDAIQADFNDIEKTQAQLITRTEVARVTSQSSLDAWEQSGLVEGKQWVVIQGGDECDAYDGEIESLSGNFYSDTSEFADGDPPIHPNCKCQLIPIILNE